MSVNEDQLLVLKKYPLLVPKNTLFTEYDGFISVKDKVFRASLEVPHYPKLIGLGICCDWELSQLLSGCSSTLTQWVSKDIPFAQFLDQLCNLIEICLEGEPGSRLGLKSLDTVDEQLLNLNRYSAVLSELRALGSEQVKMLSYDLITVSLVAHSADGYVHELTLRLAAGYPESDLGRNSLEVINTDLPDAVVKLIQKEQRVGGAYCVFCDQLEEISQIWSSLALIDQNCWVIDPTHPKKADMYRRIFVDWPRVMAQISWDPVQPSRPPDIKFQGAEAEVEAFRSRYEENLEEWSPDNSIVENVCLLLALDNLPVRPETECAVSQHVETGECSICLALQLEGNLPGESCGQCLSCFHAACLYEWLEMVPGTRQVHGHVTGTCPNCEAVIKCPCPHVTL